MKERKVMNEEELKDVNGGVSLSGGDYDSAITKNMIELKTAGVSGKGGFFSKIRLFFRRKNAAKLKASDSVTVLSGSRGSDTFC